MTGFTISWKWLCQFTNYQLQMHWNSIVHVQIFSIFTNSRTIILLFTNSRPTSFLKMWNFTNWRTKKNQFLSARTLLGGGGGGLIKILKFNPGSKESTHIYEALSHRDFPFAFPFSPRCLPGNTQGSECCVPFCLCWRLNVSQNVWKLQTDNVTERFFINVWNVSYEYGACMVPIMVHIAEYKNRGEIG